MSFNEQLAARVRPLMQRRKGFSEKKMFGGIGFLLNGNMCCGVYREQLILRLGVEAGNAALEEFDVRPFDITGRAMRGWVMVGPEGCADDEDLKRWVRAAAKFAGELPPK